MNRHEISRRTGVSLADIRKLVELGVLKVDADDDRAEAIRFHFHRNSRLTVAHLMTLIADPKLCNDLGNYADRARRQVEAMGDVENEKPARIVAHAIPSAAAGEVDALNILADWVLEATPAHDTPYHWFAVRILTAQFPSQRDETAASLNLAFAKIRTLPKLAGWWRREGTAIIYRRPLDL